MISFLNFLNDNLLTENINTSVYNSRIIELYPCVFYYINNKQPFESEDVTLDQIRNFIQTNYKSKKEFFTKKYIFKYAFVKGSPLKYILNCINPNINKGSEELTLSKVKQAIRIYNKICSEYSSEDIKNIYWTADGKPKGVDRKNTGDIFIELNGEPKTYISISLKANESKAMNPALFNPSVKSFFERFMKKEQAKELLKRISDDIFNKCYKNKFAKQGIKNITPEIFRDKNKNREWMDAFKKYVQKRQVKENINDRINDLYLPARELLNKHIANIVNELAEMDLELVKNGLTTLLTPAGNEKNIKVINKLWEATRDGLTEKTSKLNNFLDLLKQADKIKFVPNINKNGTNLKGQAYINVIKDNKVLYRIYIVIRESHKDYSRYGKFAASDNIKNINGAFKIPYLDRISLSPKL